MKILSGRRDRGRGTTWLLAVCVAIGAISCTPTEIATVLVAEGFERPVFVTSEPGNAARLYVVEQHTGLIRVVEGGAILEPPFLDVGEKLNTNGIERGLLSLAFHPMYGENGWVFVCYTALDGAVTVERYTLADNEKQLDEDSAVPIISVPHPGPVHNGGTLAFSPVDGYLYLSVGDGGGRNDPDDNGQNTGTLLGSILRLDVSGDHGPVSIPAGNPFVGNPDARDEIWAYGLRNPWRMSFDSANGDLYIGDVGEFSREEVNWQPASSMGGENYGWREAEGFVCRGGFGTCGTNPGFTPPVHDYSQLGGQAVVGGYVYRGSAIPEFVGRYFFGDYISARIWSFRMVNGEAMDLVEHASITETFGNLSSFGQDADGEIYICNYSDGSIHKIVPLPAS